MNSLAKIDAAIQAHLAWIERFKNVIAGSSHEDMESVRVQASGECAFGHWLATDEASAALGNGRFMQIVVIHDRFHKLAGVVATLLRDQQSAEMIEAKHGEMARFSTLLVQQLNDAKADLASN